MSPGVYAHAGVNMIEGVRNLKRSPSVGCRTCRSLRRQPSTAGQRRSLHLHQRQTPSRRRRLAPLLYCCMTQTRRVQSRCCESRKLQSRESECPEVLQGAVKAAISMPQAHWGLRSHARTCRSHMGFLQLDASAALDRIYTYSRH